MEVFLQLSGSIMSGYKISVSRELVNKSSKEDLIAELRNSLVKTMKNLNMEDLELLAKKIKLHIHCNIKNDMNTIYICECAQ